MSGFNPFRMILITDGVAEKADERILDCKSIILFSLGMTPNVVMAAHELAEM